MSEDLRARNRWRSAFFALLVILIASLAFLLYAIVDQGVTLTHQAEAAADATEDLAVALRLLPELRRGDRRADILVTLRRAYPEALISSTDSTISIGQLIFRFGSDDRLMQVRHPDVPVESLSRASTR
jgi:hypothetical protein